ncbi:MAG: hypothetical protein V4724_02635 [Pseudomonadota bacterium]
MHLRSFAALLYAGSAIATAAPPAPPSPPLSLCIDEQPHPPYILADGGGSVPTLVRMAAQQVGAKVEFHRAPLRRCVDEIRTGVAHGYPAASSPLAMTAEFAYPRTDSGRLDPSRATATARLAVFRRKDGAVSWDGTRFKFVKLPVLISTGSVALQAKVHAMNLAVDDQGKNLELNFAKLLAGRGDVVIGFENDGKVLLADPRFAGHIEALPALFMEEHYYLMVSKAYYAVHLDAVEALWTVIGQVRQSAAYAAAIKPR